MVRVFANGPGDLGSIPGRVIPKTQKLFLMPPCLTLSIIRYVSRVKWGNLGKGVALSPTPWCSSYRKGSPRVTLNYGRQLYLLYYLRKPHWTHPTLFESSTLSTVKHSEIFAFELPCELQVVQHAVSKSLGE